MKKKIIALISGAVILIIAAGSIYGKSESGHKELSLIHIFRKCILTSCPCCFTPLLAKVRRIREMQKNLACSMTVSYTHLVPGRKTDVKDAEWIADLVRHGLVKASYIPNRDQRELREITRYRQEVIEERARELNRIQAVLEGCNVKLSSVITDISGKSGMTILKAIVSGETDPVVLSELAEGRARDKIPEMQKSLQGRISEHQQKMLKHQLGHIESLTALIMDLDADIKKNRIHKLGNRSFG